MTIDQLKNIISQGERENVEFKENFGSKAIVAINALANTKGGYVIIGINDTAKIVGVDTNKESLQNWLNEIKQKTEPSIIPDIYEILIDDKIVVIFLVPDIPIKPVGLQGRIITGEAILTTL